MNFKVNHLLHYTLKWTLNFKYAFQTSPQSLTVSLTHSLRPLLPLKATLFLIYPKPPSIHQPSCRKLEICSSGICFPGFNFFFHFIRNICYDKIIEIFSPSFYFSLIFSSWKVLLGVYIFIVFLLSL